MNSTLITAGDAIGLVQTKRNLTPLAPAYGARGILKVRGHVYGCFQGDVGSSAFAFLFRLQRLIT